MKILRLRLTNFRQHKHLDVTFDAGLNSVIGPNWAGKSNLLASVRYALFGTKAISGGEDTLPTWGEKGFKLTLDFELFGKLISIERSKTSARVFVKGKDSETEGPSLAANGKSQVVAYVEEQLGLKQVDFDLFVMAKQGETEAALTFGATALNRKIEEFSNLDLLDRVQEKARSKVSELTLEAASLRPTDEDIAATKSSLDSSLAELREYQEKIAKDAAEAEAASKAVEDFTGMHEKPQDPEELIKQRHRREMLKVKISQAQELKEEREKFDAEAKSMLSSAEFYLSMAKGMEGDEDIHVVVNNAKEALGNIEALISKRRAYDQKRRRQEEEEARLSQHYSEVEAPYLYQGHDDGLDFLSDRLPGLEADEAEKKAAYSEATDRVASARAELKSLKSAKEKSVCPTCKRPMEGHNEEDLEKEIAESELLLSEAKADRDIKEQEAVEASDIAGWHRSDKVLLESILEKFNRLEQAGKTELLEEEEYSRERDKARDHLAKLASIKDDIFQRMTARDRAKIKAGEARDALAEACKRLSNIESFPLPDSVSDSDIERAKEAFSSYVNELSILKAQAREKAQAQDSTAAALQLVEKYAKACQEDVDKHQDKAARAQALVETSDRYKRLAAFLANNRAEYLREVWDRVLAVASRQLEVSTCGELSELRFVDGKFYFVQNGIDTLIDLASGAQKAFCGVALRVGLARALYGSSALLVFDEPTAAMTEDNASALASTMTSIAHQVILVSHRENDRALANNVIDLRA